MQFWIGVQWHYWIFCLTYLLLLLQYMLLVIYCSTSTNTNKFVLSSQFIQRIKIIFVTQLTHLNKHIWCTFLSLLGQNTWHRNRDLLIPSFFVRFKTTSMINLRCCSLLCYLPLKKISQRQSQQPKPKRKLEISQKKGTQLFGLYLWFPLTTQMPKLISANMHANTNTDTQEEEEWR